MIDYDNINNTEINDENLDSLMNEYGISDDDLMIVNNDGSYVILSMNDAELLMANPDFAHKVDIGFQNINEFEYFVKNILNQ